MPKPVSKIILPGERKPGLTVLVPRGYEDAEVRPIGVCTVIVDAAGTLCGRTYYPGEERAWQKHCGTCAADHMDEIRAASPKARMPAFDEASWDPEVAAHMRKVGKRMIGEGRLEVRKNERAGF